MIQNQKLGLDDMTKISYPDNDAYHEMAYFYVNSMNK